MNPEINVKQKILALFVVILFFIFVGAVFLTISLNNRNKTITLKEEVLKIKKNNEINENLNKILIATSTLPNITGRSFLTLAIADNGSQKILLQKNQNLVLPIASLTKLMTAVITVENIDLKTSVLATTDYIGKEESFFVLEPDRKYLVKDLLANTLIASDNDSARLLSSILGPETFLSKMNDKSAELKMTQTRYVNVTGLDPKTIGQDLNVSTVTDLAILMNYINEKHPEIFKLSSRGRYDFCDISNYCKEIVNTNKLLTDKDFKYKITGSKTGSTDLALKNLAIMISPISHISIINIVLGSEDNFTDTKSLINHLIIN